MCYLFVIFFMLQELWQYYYIQPSGAAQWFYTVNVMSNVKSISAVITVCKFLFYAISILITANSKLKLFRLLNLNWNQTKSIVPTVEVIFNKFVQELYLPPLSEW